MNAPQTPEELIVEPITKAHIVKDFDCGEVEINLYLHRFAKKSTAAGYGRTYVVTQPEHASVRAFYTLAASSIDASNFPGLSGCPKSISVILLARLGIEKDLQGRGLGEFLMSHLFDVSLQAAELIGVNAIVLTAKNHQLVEYYKRYGFISFYDEPQRMYLSIGVLKPR